MHNFEADGLKGMFNFKVIEFGILRQDGLEEFSEQGNVPLMITEMVNDLSFCFARIDPKELVECPVGPYHPQLIIEEKQWLSDCPQNFIKKE
jgi:hypothetical protein